METQGRSAESPTALAEAVESAGFVHVVTRADGDGLAAGGLLARALADRGTPYQVSVGRTVADRTERVRARESTEDDVTVTIGAVHDDADVSRLETADRPATLAALEVVRELDATPDHVLALAGLVAAGVQPGAGESEWVLETARDRGVVERRPGVSVPTDDVVDGVAHSTRVLAPWSGDPEATRAALEGLGVDLADPASFDADDHRTIGSAVALDVVGADESAPIAAETIGRALRPYATPDGPFETIGGFADVLEATARTEPGTGAALAMGHDARAPALAAWREYGRRAHAALEEASSARYDGLFVVDLAGTDDGSVEAVARIAAAFRSPEPTVLAVGDGEAALATRSDDGLGATTEAIARELDAAGIDEVAYDGCHRRGYVRYDPSVDGPTIIATARELQ